jgi:DNA-binding NarL/FixJ family response regulator
MTERPGVAGQLSRTDVEILRLLAQGFSLTRMSRQVGLSRSTLFRHTQRLMMLLGARDRAELETKVRELGLG